MLRFLIKRLIKDSHNLENPRVKKDICCLCSYFGIFLNLILFFSKYLLGIMVGSIAMIADAFNNLGDIASSSLSVFANFFAGRGPDEEHPFGHGRIEWVAASIIALAIILTGFELFRNSLNRISNPRDLKFSLFAIATMAISIVIKIYIVSYNRHFGNLCSSKTLKTVALDALSDVAASSGVLIALIIGSLTSYNIDAYIGLLVSAFVMYSGFKSIVDVLNDIIGSAPSEEHRDYLIELLHKKDPIIHVHDLFIHDYGYGRTFISLHLDVPAGYDYLKLKQIISDVNYEIYDIFGNRIAVQADFLITDRALLDEAQTKLEEVLKEIDSRITIEEFRILDGIEKLNVEFDLILPKDKQSIEGKIKARTNLAMQRIDENYRCLPKIIYK